MNRHFYEFWGSYFSNLARGQKQLEDISTFMQQGFEGSKELTELFRRCYDLAPEANNMSDPQGWQRATADFQETLNQFAKQCGWVPKNEHEQTLNTCAKLKQQVQEQEKTINRLRELLHQKGLGYTELFEHFTDSLEDQGKTFQTLLESINKASKDKS